MATPVLTVKARIKPEIGWNSGRAECVDIRVDDIPYRAHNPEL